MGAEFRVDAFPGKVFKGIVSVINPTLDPATRTGRIEIHIPNKDLTLHSGMFAHVRLALGEREALVISKDALNRLPGTGSYYVYVVEGGKALMKNIKIGVSQEDHVEVLEGLKVGEQVVVKGQNRLKDGTSVMVKRQVAREEGK
jgi:RND family efflux transporter MFP subunit